MIERRQTSTALGGTQAATSRKHSERRVLPSDDQVERPSVVEPCGASSIFDDAEEDGIPPRSLGLNAALGLISLRESGGGTADQQQQQHQQQQQQQQQQHDAPTPPCPSEWILAQQQQQIKRLNSQQNLIVNLALLERANLEAAALAADALLRHHLEKMGLEAGIKRAIPRTPGDISLSSSEIGEDDLRETDVICGRGGKSNHWPGNKRYRQVISDTRQNYRGIPSKNEKTAMSEAIVDLVKNYGGRFLRKNPKSGKYFEMTKGEARRKVAQALRETKELKWTM